MACNNCGRRTAREWRYCPYCGTRITREPGLFESIERMFKGLFSGQRGIQFSPTRKSKFTIRIRDGKKERVISNIKPKSQVKISSKPGKKLEMPDELIEPEASVKRRGRELEVSVELPGVNSLKKVSVTRLGESIEVRAVSDGKGYFKIINVPENYRVIKKKLSDEVLSVRLRGK